ncbi:MAG: hypothetical protein M3Q64_03030 [bacterium]|nr:hypothetical protein [bacterium]
MFFEDDDQDRTTVGDTVEGIADGVKDGDAGQVGDAIKDDAAQTKDDVEDVVRGEDGNNR